MTENLDEKLLIIAKEFKIAEGLETNTHIKHLEQIEKFPQAQAVALYNYFLTIETNPEVLNYLLKVISKHHQKCSLGVLTDLLLWKENFQKRLKTQDKCLNLRISAAKIIGNLKDNDSVLHLLYILNNKDENYKLRLSCAEALGRIGNTYAVAPLIDVVSDEEEKSVYLRESAATALGLLGDIRAVDPLLNILETKKGLVDKFTFLKEKVIESIGRIGWQDDRSFKALKNALIDESPYIRIGAIETLSGREDDDRVVPLIKGMLHDSDEEVARSAVTALYNVLGKEVLLDILDSNECKVWCKEEAQIILDEYENEEDDNE